MTENGPVASMWGVWDASWQEQGVRIERVSDDLFTVTRLSDMTTTERLVRSSTGPWRLQWLDAAGQWNTFETIPRGCPDGLAAGAAMFLGSMGDV